MKILYAEDEINSSEHIQDILTIRNYKVDAVYNGKDAIEYAKAESYEGIIIDATLPDCTGIEVLKKLRSEGITAPVMLTNSKDTVADRIVAYDAGADDVMVKPVDPDEFLARVRALLRRGQAYTPDILKCGEMSLNRSSYELTYGEERISLPKNEYQMMEILMLNQSKYIAGEELLRKIWGYDSDAEISTVWVYISYLRKRLKALGANVSITSMRNVGYKLEISTNQK